VVVSLFWDCYGNRGMIRHGGKFRGRSFRAWRGELVRIEETSTIGYAKAGWCRY